MTPPRSPSPDGSASEGPAPAALVSLAPFGVPLRIRGPEELRAELEALLPPGATAFDATFPPHTAALPVPGRSYTVKAAGDGVRVAVAGGRLEPDPEVPDALRALAADAQIHVAAHAPRAVFVHAGVVAWEGEALLLPGVSRAGKTTLVSRLIEAGGTYYSDDYAVLDPDGRVWPFPRRLGIRLPGGARSDRGAAELGAVTGTEPAAVRWIVNTAYVPDRALAPRRMTGGEAVLSLLANAPAARVAPGRVLRVLERAVADAEAWQGPRGDADATLEALHALTGHP